MVKYHTDEIWLNEQIQSGETSRTLANKLHVSYKLIEIYLNKYGIKHSPGKRV
jgi:hypothetical protein